VKIDRSHIEIAVAANLILMAATAIWFIPTPKGKMYNCSISEISPDYPLQVKEECRKLRATKS
jgi:hypothetical protein